jgi:hypothetical protein
LVGARPAGAVRHLVVAVLAYALFISGIVHPFWHAGGHHFDDGWLGWLAENAYALGCLALLVVLPARTRECARG